MSARAALSPTRALLDVVVLAALSGILLTVWLVFAHDAFRYYTTPLTVRGYEKAHRLLRPSGEIGHLLGLAGTFFLISTLPYVARRRIRKLSRLGSVARWLEAHIFCGVFGPILITFHTSLKFNGLVSVAYWSMVLVMVSGFVGRYLYVRIPRTIRGEELTFAQLEQRAAELKSELANVQLPPALRAGIDEEEQRVLAGKGRSLGRIRRELRSGGIDRSLVHDVLALARERAVLVRRIARLEKTRRLFQLWHVFHRPFVWVMFVILVIHVSVAIYFGYMPFGV